VSAEAAMESSAARIPDLEMQIAMKENQISVLVGSKAGPIVRDSHFSDEALPPEVPAGIPSDLLERRPDVREAEYAAKLPPTPALASPSGGFLPRIGLSAILGGRELATSAPSPPASRVFGPSGRAPRAPFPRGRPSRAV
jgi:multidrug efflux system outer membrane protein